MMETIAMILRALGVAAMMPEVFGGKAEQFAPILATLASLAELPGETRPQQEALLSLVNTWVSEKRPPSTNELDAFRTVRESNNQRLLDIKASLEAGGAA